MSPWARPQERRRTTSRRAAVLVNVWTVTASEAESLIASLPPMLRSGCRSSPQRPTPEGLRTIADVKIADKEDASTDLVRR